METLKKEDSNSKSKETVLNKPQAGKVAEQRTRELKQKADDYFQSIICNEAGKKGFDTFFEQIKQQFPNIGQEKKLTSTSEKKAFLESVIGKKGMELYEKSDYFVINTRSIHFFLKGGGSIRYWFESSKTKENTSPQEESSEQEENDLEEYQDQEEYAVRHIIHSPTDTNAPVSLEEQYKHIEKLKALKTVDDVGDYLKEETKMSDEWVRSLSPTLFEMAKLYQMAEGLHEEWPDYDVLMDEGLKNEQIKLQQKIGLALAKGQPENVTKALRAMSSDEINQLQRVSELFNFRQG